MHSFLKFNFGMKLLRVSDSSSVHHQEFFTVHTANVYVIQVWWKVVSRSICSCSQAVSKPVWHIPLLCVQWKTPDDGQRKCPKHVEFHSKNKREKFVHLVGFIIRNWTRCTVTWKSNRCRSRFRRRCDDNLRVFSRSIMWTAFYQ